MGPGGCRGGGEGLLTSALAAVGVLSEAVAARMVVSKARDKAVAVVLADALTAGGRRVLGSGGAGQASLGGWGSKKSCLHTCRRRLTTHIHKQLLEGNGFLRMLDSRCIDCAPCIFLHSYTG